MAAQTRICKDLIKEFSAELCDDALEFVPVSLNFCLFDNAAISELTVVNAGEGSGILILEWGSKIVRPMC